VVEEEEVVGLAVVAAVMAAAMEVAVAAEASLVARALG
jgi:hypothetical protein